MDRIPMRHESTIAFIFDLDGTLVDSVYQHVLAWHAALADAALPLAVWRIHRRIGMSGGLLTNALLREMGREITPDLIEHVRKRHTEAFLPQVGGIRSFPRRLRPAGEAQPARRGRSPSAAGWRRPARCSHCSGSIRQRCRLHLDEVGVRATAPR